MSDGETIVRSKRPLVYYLGNGYALSERIMYLGLSNAALGFFIRLSIDRDMIPGGAHSEAYDPVWIELKYHRLADRKKAIEYSDEPKPVIPRYHHVVADFDRWPSHREMDAALAAEAEEKERWRKGDRFADGLE